MLASVLNCAIPHMATIANQVANVHVNRNIHFPGMPTFDVDDTLMISRVLEPGSRKWLTL